MGVQDLASLVFRMCDKTVLDHIKSMCVYHELSVKSIYEEQFV